MPERRPEELAGVADADLSGRTVLVTGATDGVGRELALALGRLGATVLAHGRSPEKGEAVFAALSRAAPDADLYLADFASQAAVRDLAASVHEDRGALDALVNNAGTHVLRPEVTEDGVEKTMAVNHLAPFLLTNLLRPALRPGARVVTTASEAHRSGTIDPDRPAEIDDYDGFGTYARSKLANVMFTAELARRLDDATANCFHPGLVPGSALWRDSPLRVKLGVRALTALPRVVSGRVASTPAEGATTGAYLVASDEVAANGAYFSECEPTEPSPAARDPDAQRRLWEASAELVGLPAE